MCVLTSPLASCIAAFKQISLRRTNATGRWKGPASLTSRPVSSHFSFPVSRMKVERAKLVERPYEPYFALGLISQSVGRRQLQHGARKALRALPRARLRHILSFQILRRRLRRPSWWKGPLCLTSPLASSPSESHSKDEEQTLTHCLISRRVSFS